MPEYKRYPKYESIDYDYIKALPSSWQLLPNIAIFEERIERGHVNEELLSVTIGRGVIKQTDVDIKKDSSNEDKSNYKLVKPGDIAYNKMRMWQGALGFSQYTGIASPAYVVLKPKMTINPKFFHYMFRSIFYTNYSKRFSYGIVDDQLSLRYVDFKRMYSIVPPLETQDAIVTNLNYKTKVIDKYISNVESLIALLEQKSDKIISDAVTLGIQNNIKFKSLDDDWLKNIPCHWVYKQLKYFVITNKSALPESTNPNYELLYIDIGNVTFRGLVSPPELYYFKDAPSRARRIIKPGDTILSTVRTYLKAITFFDECPPNLIASTGFAVISPKSNVIPRYLKYMLSSSFFINKVNFWANGVNYPCINNDKLKAIKIPLPPSISEQETIINHIESALYKLNDAISKAKKEIEIIKEYRESLITAAITGQINVSENQTIVN